MIDEATIRKAVELICENSSDSRVIVFGSHGRGDNHPDSDLDLLVVQPFVKSRRNEMVRLADLLRPLRISADVIVVSQQSFQRWRDTPGTIIYEAAREGREIHARA